MPETISRTEFEHLRREIEETRTLVEDVFAALYGRERVDSRIRVSRFLARERRDATGTPITEVLNRSNASWRLRFDADICTLEEAARRTRAEVAAVEGVGRVALAKLESAMAERDLEWAAA